MHSITLDQSREPRNRCGSLILPGLQLKGPFLDASELWSESGVTRLIYYDYFEVQSDGHIAALSLPQWVNGRRSYGQASQRLLTPEELESMDANVELILRAGGGAEGH